MSVYPSRLVSVGIAKETGYGAAAAPVTLIPTGPPTHEDVVRYLTSKAWTGAPADTFGHVVASLTSTLALQGPVFADSIGYPLAGILGDVHFAAGSPNTWTMALRNDGDQQPPSYTVTVDDPIGQACYAGCRFTAVQIAAAADGLLSWQASLAGLATPVTATGYTMPAASGEHLLPGWGGSVQIGGLADTRVLDATLNLTRPVEAKFTVTEDLEPWNQRSDLLGVSAQFTLAASADSYHAWMTSGTATSLLVQFTGAGRLLQLACSTVTLTKVTRAYGSRFVELTVTAEADANSSDAGTSGGLSPVKATLQNTVPSGTYA